MRNQGRGKKPGRPGSGPNGGRPTHHNGPRNGGRPPHSPPHTPHNPPAPPAPPPAGPNPLPDPTYDQDAFDVLRQFFESMGITFDVEIEDLIKEAMIDGYGPDQISLIMPDLEKTQAFKKRFSGYHQRVANGYNAISIGEYLQLENTYHRIMQEAGLPAGFYDDPSDFGKFIADNVSPDEIQNRVGMAVKTAQSIDPTARNLMTRFYGLGTGDIASYFLDQTRALPVIERQYSAANVASWAAKAGFGVNDMQRYESLVDSGVTTEAAASQYGTIKSLADTVGNIAGVYGSQFDQTDAENDVFFGRSDKRRKLVSQEAATFSGQSRGATGSANRQSY